MKKYSLTRNASIGVPRRCRGNDQSVRSLETRYVQGCGGIDSLSSDCDHDHCVRGQVPVEYHGGRALYLCPPRSIRVANHWSDDLFVAHALGWRRGAPPHPSLTKRAQIHPSLIRMYRYTFSLMEGCIDTRTLLGSGVWGNEVSPWGCGDACVSTNVPT